MGCCPVLQVIVLFLCGSSTTLIFLVGFFHGFNIVMPKQCLQLMLSFHFFYVPFMLFGVVL